MSTKSKGIKAERELIHKFGVKEIFISNQVGKLKIFYNNLQRFKITLNIISTIKL